MNGRNVHPDHIDKQLEKAVIEATMRDFLHRVEKLTRDIHDSKTGALPRFPIKGNKLGKLSVEVIGSEVITMLQEE